MDKVKTFGIGVAGAVLMIVLYQVYLDHMRIKQVCSNVATATAGKFVCW